MESKEFKALKEQLLSCRRNGFDRMDAAERSAMESYCTDYKAFLDTSKTERLCAGEVVRLAEQAGYRPYVRGAAVKPGDKVYLCNRGKSVLLAHIGEKPLAEGVQIAAAHIDSPREKRSTRSSGPSGGRRPWNGRPSPWAAVRVMYWSCPWDWIWGISENRWGRTGGTCCAGGVMVMMRPRTGTGSGIWRQRSD